MAKFYTLPQNLDLSNSDCNFMGLVIGYVIADSAYGYLFAKTPETTADYTQPIGKLLNCHIQQDSTYKD